MADNTVAIRVVVRDATRDGVGSVRHGLDGMAMSIAKVGGGAGAIQVLLGLAAAAQQLAGALLVLPGALSMVAAIGGTLKLGLSGVSEALSATSSGSAKAGVSATASAKQIRDANKQIVDAYDGVTQAGKRVEAAQRGVAAANRQVEAAARGVTMAIRRVDDATDSAAAAGVAYQKSLKNEERAQQDITTARQDAQRTLDDLVESQDDLARGVQGAELALKRALADQIKVMKDSKASFLDREEAAFKVTEAEDKLSDSQKASVDGTKKLTDAQAKGIEGSDQVVAAQEAATAAHEATIAAGKQVVDSNLAIADAQYDLAQAHLDEADAQQGVIDANDAVVEAQKGVVKANEDVADAIQNLSDIEAQQREAAMAAAGGTDAYAAAMAKLSPEARKFVEVIKELTPAWDDMQKHVQNELFAGISDQVRDLAGVYIPLLKTGLGDIAGELNSMAGYALDQLLDPAAVDAVNTILGNTSALLDGAETSLGDFVTGFLNLAAIGSDYLPGIGTWLADIAASFREWTETDPEGIRKLIEDGITGFGDLWAIIMNVKDIIGGLFSGLSGGEGDGPTFLETVASWTQSLSDFVNNESTQAVLGVLGQIIGLIVQMAPIWIPIAAAIYLVSTAMGVLNVVMNMNPIGIIIIAVVALIAIILYLWNNVEGFRLFWTYVWQNAVDSFNFMKDGVVTGFNWLVDALTTAVNWVKGILSDMWGGLTSGLKSAANGAITGLNGLIKGLNIIIQGLNVVNPFSDIPYVPYVPYLAKGGIAGGLAMVGEKGPELVNLPQGSTVYPTGQSMGMLGAMGGQGGGEQRVTLVALPGSSDAVATMIMTLVRQGKLQLKAA